MESIIIVCFVLFFLLPSISMSQGNTLNHVCNLDRESVPPAAPWLIYCTHYALTVGSRREVWERGERTLITGCDFIHDRLLLWLLERQQQTERQRDEGESTRGWLLRSIITIESCFFFLLLVPCLCGVCCYCCCRCCSFLTKQSYTLTDNHFLYFSLCKSQTNFIMWREWSAGECLAVAKFSFVCYYFLVA